MRSLKGNTDVVAPISAPMLQMVPIPVDERELTPGPWYSMIAPVPPLTVRIPATLRMMSGQGGQQGPPTDLGDLPFGEVQPDICPVSLTPMTLGAFSSHGRLAMTSTASAPPTPMAHMPSPPALGVWESVPIMRPPGKA